jgi:hypothetical protein
VAFHFDFGVDAVVNTRYNIHRQYSGENLKKAYKAIGRKVD